MATRTVTVLFTDLVGSTELLSRLGPDRAEELRVEHFSLLRDAIAAHDGREVKNLGDGLMVAFDGVRAALDAAVAMQQGLDVRNRSAKESLLVRIGVAMGEADVDGDDYFGVPVVEASRLCETAVGGQILTTEFVRVLAGSRGEHTFEALGAVELRGLDTPVDTHEVTWEPLTGAAAGGIELPARLVPRSDAVFVGRASERATLRQALDTVEREPARRIVLVSGEAGIGKTTLVSEVASAAHEAGVLVTYGRCDEELSIPYQPWREAMTHLVDQGVVDADAVEILLRDDAEHEVVDNPEAARYYLARAVLGALAAASDTQRLLVVLDDLHWADAPTVGLLRQLGASDDQARLVVVATFRDAEIIDDHPMAEALAALHRESGVDRVALSGLDDDEVLAMLEALAGHELDPDALELRDALRAETEGNPFFTVEILRHLSETGAITQDDTGRWVGSVDLAEHGLPVSLREVLGQRVARFDADTQRLLRTAAVIGRDFDVDLLAEVVATRTDDVLDLLDPVEETGLVIGIGDNRYTFAHALVGHTLYEELSVTRRERTHRAVAEALETSLGDDPGARVGELARHWTAAGARDTTRAVAAALHAGDHALANLVPDEAERWYRRGLAVLDNSGLDRADTEERRSRAALLAGLGEALRDQADPDYRAVLVQAGTLAARENDTDTLVRAALATNLGNITQIGVVSEDIVDLLRAAIDAVEGEASPREARLLACLATEYVSSDPGQAAALASSAMAIARDTGDDATLAWTGLRATQALRPQDDAQRTTWTLETLEAAERVDDPDLLASALHRLAYSGMMQGDVTAADEAISRMAVLADQTIMPISRWVILSVSVARHLVSGDPEAAEHTLDEMFRIETATANTLMGSFTLLMMVRDQQGRSAELFGLVEEAVAANPGIPAFRVGYAYLLLREGRRDEAERMIADDIADDFAAQRMDEIWMSFHCVATEMVCDLGLVDSAQVLYERLEPFAEQVAITPGAAYEVMHFQLGNLAATLGRDEDADRHFARAEEIHEAMEAKYFLAHTRWRWAEVLAKRDDPDDRAKAITLAEAAHAASVEHGYARIERHSGELLDTMRS